MGVSSDETASRLAPCLGSGVRLNQDRALFIAFDHRGLQTIQRTHIPLNDNLLAVACVLGLNEDMKSNVSHAEFGARSTATEAAQVFSEHIRGKTSEYSHPVVHDVIFKS